MLILLCVLAVFLIIIALFAWDWHTMNKNEPKGFGDD
jgi:hypothetical protein